MNKWLKIILAAPPVLWLCAYTIHFVYTRRRNTQDLKKN